MKVREVMTSSVVMVTPDTSPLEAGELMLQHDISGLPEVDKEARLVGLITECKTSDFNVPLLPAEACTVSLTISTGAVV